jgi:secreted PhoX family phosphatase
MAIHSRLAGDAVGATKMDRPEWCGGDIPSTWRDLLHPDQQQQSPPGHCDRLSAQPGCRQPRVYTDIRKVPPPTRPATPTATSSASRRAGNDDPRPRPSAWDIYLFGAETGRPPGIINLSGLSADQDFSSPDGLVFAPSTGLCWVQTDDGAYTDVTNCMMLAGVPGTVGDGGSLTLD